MKIKEVQAGVKVSSNYNSYSINLTANLEENESYEEIGKFLIEKAKEIIDDKIENKNEKEIETGAAWYSKNSPRKLSVQYSKNGPFLELEIEDLEEGEFKQIIEGETFVFRRIPLEKRKSSKMPVFRVYKEVKNE
ncbi:MAG: hypothetical protein KKB62_00515 [Nanoarchaeota archaeon]|nr:hypothetical protein [Nanoarchaeota archaeon]